AYVSDCVPVSGTALTTVVIASEPDIDKPVFVTSPPGDPRLFVVEKCGTIRIIENEQVLAKPFLDISVLAADPEHQRVNCDGDEEGLLGMAFHPGYSSNGRFFVNYIEQPGGNETRNTVVAQYQVSSDRNVAELTEKRIIVFGQPQANHNAGMLAFGPDGYLYIGTGDGGGAGDPQGNGQNVTAILGSMLRLDVNVAGAYEIPSSNPFATSADGPTDPRPEIWAKGLRNPWRYSFDRETGDLYIGDVGQGDWEEINVQPASSRGGENYGWDILEGEHCYPDTVTDCNRANMVEPVAEYPHVDVDANHRDKSVTGGYVYRGRCLPDIRGWYFYADYGSARIRSFEYRDGAAQNNRILEGVNFGERIVSFGEDAAGELYVINMSPDQIRKVVPVQQ
ncbi:MAG TPA: PQQ-dependent sugar dehydrogenase, partial [Haliangium sp.]|nr:PQQ-dependent sugar dehydrogenase [Haliangium sp.]